MRAFLLFDLSCSVELSECGWMHVRRRIFFSLCCFCIEASSFKLQSLDTALDFSCLSFALKINCNKASESEFENLQGAGHIARR